MYVSLDTGTGDGIIRVLSLSRRGGGSWLTVSPGDHPYGGSPEGRAGLVLPHDLWVFMALNFTARTGLESPGQLSQSW